MYMKRALLFSFALFLSSALLAQTQPLQATVSGGVTQNNIYAVAGQPTAAIVDMGNYEFTSGMAQAQLVKDTVYDVVTYNDLYTANGFDLPAQSLSHKESRYIVNGGIFNYDVVRTLYLIVCPQTVNDKQDNTIVYNAVGVSGHCWTKQNLRTPDADAMTYSSVLHPTVPEEYGLLYTWQTALNGTSTDADGFVQGLCPANWHLPTAEEATALNSNPTVALRSVTGWMNGETNTNTTGFTAYPAGQFSAALERFEGFGTQTDWWMVSGTTVNGTATGTQNYTSLQIPYFCDSPMNVSRSANDAISVRCVMKNVWPD